MTYPGKRRMSEKSLDEASETKRRRIGDDLLHDVASNDCDPSRHPKPPALVRTSPDSSVTLDGNSPPVDKGKGVERDPVLIELERLRELVAAQAALLKAKESALDRIEKEVSCSICMDMAPLPYILPACGHIYCHECLAQWFTTLREGEVLQEPEPHASDGDDSSDNELDGTDPAPGEGPPPVIEPPRPPYPNVKARVKMCPFCRAIVKERPTPLRNFVNIATIIRGDQEIAPPNYSKKNWRNIFQLKPSDKRAPQAPRASSVNSENSDGVVGAANRERQEQPDDFSDLPPIFVDREDGVTRCGRCFHELWDGRCSNEECQADYNDPSNADGDDSGDDLVRILGGAWVDPIDDDDDDDDVEDEEDEFEGSFIDGGDDRGHDSDGFLSGPPRRLTKEMTLDNAFDDNEYESESEGDEAGLHTRLRRGNRLTFNPRAIPSSSGDGSDDAESSRNGLCFRERSNGHGSARGNTTEYPITIISSGEEESGPSHRHARRLDSQWIVSDDGDVPGPSPRHVRRGLILSDNEEQSDRPSDTSYSHSRSQVDEEEFLGFGDYISDDSDEQNDPGSDASAANPFEEDDEEGFY